MTSQTAPPIDRHPPRTILGLLTVVMQADILGVSAAIAYYTVLSLTPIVLLCFTILSLLGLKNFGEFEKTLSDTLGAGAGLAIQAVRQRMELGKNPHYAIGLLGIGAMLVSGSGVISEIQSALNHIFQCRPGPKKSSATTDLLMWLRGKALSMLVLSLWVGVLALSLIVSLAINLIPQVQGSPWFHWLSSIAAYFIFAIIFSFMFQYLPAKREHYSLALFMGLICSGFFHLGRWGLLLYFKLVNMETTYGALGSAIVLLIWAYYNGIIIILTSCIGRVFLLKRRS